MSTDLNVKPETLNNFKRKNDDFGSTKFSRAALEYAKLGIPIFPLAPNEKVPLGGHGFKDATTDPATVMRWWANDPQANIGMAMGDIVVLDVDEPDGRSTLKRLMGVDDPFQLTPLIQRTPSGGLHLFFNRAGVLVRNRAGDIGPGLDTRGVNRNGGPAGYAALAPSTAESKIDNVVRPYRLEVAPNEVRSIDQLWQALPGFPKELDYLSTFGRRERELIENKPELRQAIKGAEPSQYYPRGSVLCASVG